jgi:hypothetical protein
MNTGEICIPKNATLACRHSHSSPPSPWFVDFSSSILVHVDVFPRRTVSDAGDVKNFDNDLLFSLSLLLSTLLLILIVGDDGMLRRALALPTNLIVPPSTKARCRLDNCFVMREKRPLLVVVDDSKDNTIVMKNDEETIMMTTKRNVDTNINKSLER